MKIGIITLPLHTNYGGLLQAYALQTVLQRLGHEVQIISGEMGKLKFPFLRFTLILIKRIVYRYLLLKTNIVIFKEDEEFEKYQIISRYTQPFVDRYLNLSRVGFDRLESKDWDVLIVGSDQIWRPKYTDNIYDSFFGFARNWKVRRIAYAPSFGTADWEYDSVQTDKCASLLKKFDAVMVREASGVVLCKDKLGCDAVHVVDPTMLLDVNDYMELVKKASVGKSKGTLLNYILDETEEKSLLIDEVTKVFSLVSFRVNSKSSSPDAPIEDRIKPPVEQWLQGFSDAEFVITDSFHACVFSILFNKPFLVVGNKSRGLARFESLLDMFDLQDRMVESVEDISRVITRHIDWDLVNNRLVEWKQNSIASLKEALQ